MPAPCDGAALVARAAPTPLRDDVRDRRVEVPRVDVAPRVLAEPRERRVDDERAALDVLRDLERRDRL